VEINNDDAAARRLEQPELYTQIVRLLDRAVMDEDRQPELDAQFDNIYDALPILISATTSASSMPG
jgi:hypothetical protein